MRTGGNPEWLENDNQLGRSKLNSQVESPFDSITKKHPQPSWPPPENSFHPLTLREWREWLELHHEQSEGLWLIRFKQTTGKPAISYDESVEEALCFGWVDSKPGKLDDTRTMLYFAPRKPKSGWAKTNKARVEKLIAEGRMTASGLAKIEEAKRDGSWSKLDEVEKLTIPPDLSEALASNPPAALHFAAFPKSVKRGILEWIEQAKRPETRVKRINETATLAAQNLRANQWPPQKPNPK
jgi:uncharacterized protein YdeI (YjbR/CyaY-like superfamily)